MNKTPPSIGDILQKSQPIGALMPTVERHLALQRDVALVLQPLLQPLLGGNQRLNPLDLCCVLRLDQGTLSLAVRNASLAARFRQVLPRLEAGLGRSGWKVSAIRLRVQPESFIEKTGNYVQKTFPGTGLAAFSELLQTLPPSELRSAVASLVKHHRR